MKLQNGKYYMFDDGSVMKAQKEADGKFHCYNPSGSAIMAVEPDTHVEGIVPCGAAKFNEAKAKGPKETFEKVRDKSIPMLKKKKKSSFSGSKEEESKAED